LNHSFDIIFDDNILDNNRIVSLHAFECSDQEHSIKSILDNHDQDEPRNVPSVSSRGVSGGVDESCEEQDHGEDEGWEWEDKRAESNSKHKLDGVLNEMVKRSVGSVVKSFISLRGQKDSAF